MPSGWDVIGRGRGARAIRRRILTGASADSRAVAPNARTRVTCGCQAAIRVQNRSLPRSSRAVDDFQPTSGTADGIATRTLGFRPGTRGARTRRRPAGSPPEGFNQMSQGPTRRHPEKGQRHMQLTGATGWPSTCPTAGASGNRERRTLGAARPEGEEKPSSRAWRMPDCSRRAAGRLARRRPIAGAGVAASAKPESDGIDRDAAPRRRAPRRSQTVPTGSARRRACGPRDARRLRLHRCALRAPSAPRHGRARRPRSPRHAGRASTPGRRARSAWRHRDADRARSKYRRLPAMSVRHLARKPPVQDSAVTIMSPALRSRASRPRHSRLRADVADSWSGASGSLPESGPQPLWNSEHGLLLRHDHALAMSSRLQSLLVDLADTSCPARRRVDRVRPPLQLLRDAVRRYRRQQPVHGQFNMLGTSRQDADAAHIVRMRDDEEASP